jgi:hypothetical protein
LPPKFYDTVRRQYTAAHAAQELEGEFTDAGGTLFRRYWFGVVNGLMIRCRRGASEDKLPGPEKREGWPTRSE